MVSVLLRSTVQPHAAHQKLHSCRKRALFLHQPNRYVCDTSEPRIWCELPLFGRIDFLRFKASLSLNCNLDRGADFSRFANRTRFTSVSVDTCVTELFFDLSSRRVAHVEAFGRNNTMQSDCSFKRNEALKMIITTCTCTEDYCNNLIGVNEMLGKIERKTRVVNEIANQLHRYLFGTAKGDKRRRTASLILAYILLTLLLIIVWIHFIGSIFYQFFEF
ncbi:hypothetical protein Y032_0068g175 [Ancylostoma ceylanicum]|uniref:Uncharacterized protein n=1 Tax=Ancylostoma ceylanicum TaxID=53326 RepID=A0A016TZR8_9BILA|nr:hypothetical protein Y032_0068g175 [Ancylostoma ceylanicum]